MEDDINEIIMELNWIEPFVILQPGEDDNYFASLIIDRIVIPLDYLPIDRIFDKLFKSFFIFNLHYNKQFQKFFEFFELVVYKIKNRMSSCAISKFENFLYQ